ncbi:FAD-dependent oxidoreductase [Smaragdicoccus niigatensis]|uniref:FAD-dependent oxidoreductase n=1 Tax=Smaragdicoccus niigatensis TaxID=359359 RepID=UPI00036048BF|nr:FAD-dependent oxidoreductase [Smaragdicoccus niigatensis]
MADAGVTTTPDTFELCVVGAGIAGLNALVAATKYLGRNDRVVLVDARQRPGGMWVDTYDYVRLHQPHRIFTAGNIAWRPRREPSYLAAKTEVLDHLQHCVDVARHKVDLTEQFGCEYLDHEEAAGSIHVRFRAPDGQVRVVTTKRLIKAFGNRVLPSSPLSLSSANVRSTTPERLTAESEELTASVSPVWIIGSGKTAIDTAHMLLTADPGRSVNMVAGSGTFFSRRETFFPTGVQRWVGGTRINAMLRETALRFDGTNEDDVARWFQETYGLNPAGAARQFFSAYLSEQECTTVQSGLDHVEAGYLADVADSPAGPELVFRDGRKLPIPAGSWIVNCTGYLVRTPHPYEPFVSESGNVASVQLRSCVTGPFTSFAGYYVSHLMFREKLGTAGLYELDLEALGEKSRTALMYAAFTQSLLNLGIVAGALPNKVILDCGLDFDRWYPAPRRMAGAIGLLLTQRADRKHCVSALTALSERFDVRFGRVQVGGSA